MCSTCLVQYSRAMCVSPAAMSTLVLNSTPLKTRVGYKIQEHILENPNFALQGLHGGVVLRNQFHEICVACPELCIFCLKLRIFCLEGLHNTLLDRQRPQRDPATGRKWGERDPDGWLRLDSLLRAKHGPLLDGCGQKLIDAYFGTPECVVFRECKHQCTNEQRVQSLLYCQVVFIALM